MVTVLFLIFLGCSAVAKEIENCNRIQFSFDDEKGINRIQNFTKQSFEKNEKPVYYSYNNQDLQTLIWWSNENNAWLSQTRPHSGNKIKNIKKHFSPKLYLYFSQ